MNPRLGALLVLVLLAGCGTQFVYNNMDWFVIDYVEDYVDLTDEQETVIIRRVDLWKDWLKQEELPTYKVHLQRLETMEPSQFTLAQLEREEQSFQQHTQRLISRAAPDVYALTRQLSDEQVNEFIDNLTDKQEAFRRKRESRSDKQHREHYQERITERLEQWLGRLNDQQHQLVRQWANEVEITSPAWIEHQRQMRSELHTLLIRRDDLTYFQPRFNRLMFNYDSYYSDELTQKMAFNRNVARKKLVAIVRSMNSRQTRYFRDELSEWRAMFDKLDK